MKKTYKKPTITTIPVPDAWGSYSTRGSCLSGFNAGKPFGTCTGGGNPSGAGSCGSGDSPSPQNWCMAGNSVNDPVGSMG